jgi:hypothetical protein
MLKRFLIPLAIFVTWVCLVALGSNAPRYSRLAKVADLTLLAMHLGLMAFLSVLVLRDRWHDSYGRPSRPTLLKRIWAWITDERPSH